MYIHIISRRVKNKAMSFGAKKTGDGRKRGKKKRILLSQFVLDQIIGWLTNSVWAKHASSCKGRGTVGTWRVIGVAGIWIGASLKRLRTQISCMYRTDWAKGNGRLGLHVCYPLLYRVKQEEFIHVESVLRSRIKKSKYRVYYQLCICNSVITGEGERNDFVCDPATKESTRS